MNRKNKLHRGAVAIFAFVAASCSAGSDIGGPTSNPDMRLPNRSTETSISVVDLAAGTGLFGRALHVNAVGYVLGTLGTDPISPKGFGYWAPSSASFNVIDASIGMTDLGKGNAAGDWTEYYDFPRVWLISGANSWTPTTLAFPSGASAVRPAAINANRVVVGSTSVGPARWESPNSSAVLLPLPTISGIDASSNRTWGINNNGDIVGSVNATSGKVTTLYALLWTANGQVVRVLPLAPGASSQRATGINDAGVIVGYFTGTGGRSYPMRWTPDGIAGYTISTLTTWTSEDLNGSIDKCGRAVGGISGKGYVWDASGSLTLLPLLAGASEADAAAINDAGTVVGETKFVVKGKVYYKPTLWKGLPACP